MDGGVLEVVVVWLVEEVWLVVGGVGSCGAQIWLGYRGCSALVVDGEGPGGCMCWWWGVAGGEGLDAGCS